MSLCRYCDQSLLLLDSKTRVFGSFDNRLQHSFGDLLVSTPPTRGFLLSALWFILTLKLRGRIVRSLDLVVGVVISDLIKVFIRIQFTFLCVNDDLRSLE